MKQKQIDKAKLLAHLNESANYLREKGAIVPAGTLIILRDEIESGTFDIDEPEGEG